MKKLPVKWLIGLPPLAYLLLFFAIPSLIMVLASFRYPGEYGGLYPFWHSDCETLPSGLEQCKTVIDITRDTWRDYLTIEPYQRFFADKIWMSVFLKSIIYAAITSVLCLVMAYPLAWMIARTEKSRAELLILLVILPFWSNFLVRIYAWIIILGPQAALSVGLNKALALVGLGPVSLIHNSFAVIVGLVYVHLPFMVLPLYANLEKHEMSLLDAAQDLGANAFQRFWRITLPLSLPGIFAGIALVFIPALGMFAIPELLGGPNDTLIGNLIRDQFREARDWPFGSVLSIMLTVMVLILAGFAAWMARQDRESDYA